MSAQAVEIDWHEFVRLWWDPQDPARLGLRRRAQRACQRVRLAAEWADEVAQEALVRVMSMPVIRAAPGGEHEAVLKLLHTILHRTAVDVVRGLVRDSGNGQVLLSDPATPPSQQLTVPAPVELSRAQLEAVLEAESALPENIDWDAVLAARRVGVVLALWRGEPSREALCAAHGLSRAALRADARRGRFLLVGWLRGLGLGRTETVPDQMQAYVDQGRAAAQRWAAARTPRNREEEP